ncbi:hypothetical protein AGMMS49991_09830 [Spirochaetia bacterium]|nr:hypothetical protein AGMMS49991_09830 [Spirochaetia bacterium]
MKKRYSGRLSPSALYIGLTLLCVGLLGFVGCADPIPQVGNQIVSFVINGSRGAINDEERTITVTMPGATDLSVALSPEIKISSGATVEPASGVGVVLNNPIAYVVQAENGDVRHYTVTAVLDPATVLTGISVAPVKTSYAAGAAIQPADVVVTGIYKDGSTKKETVTASDLAVSATTAGKQTVVVTFNGKTATYDVDFVAAASLVGISVTRLKTTNYNNGQAIVPATDILVTGTYSDGSTQRETITTAMLSGYVATQAGTQTVVVTFNGKTATFTVTVNVVKSPTTLTSLAVPIQLQNTFPSGTPIATILAQTVINGTYSDGTSEKVTVVAANVSGYDPNKVGAQTLRVAIGDRAVTFNVTIEQSPSDVTITVGLPSNGQDVPFYFGDGTDPVTVPANQIIELSAHGIGKPKNLVINAAGFTSVNWYIDNVAQTTFNTGNTILNLLASNYTYGNEHTITFIGTRNGVQFSRTIWFVVEY